MYICEKCDSDNVEQLQWVNPNTNKLGEIAAGERQDSWCNTCDEHTNIIYKEIITKQ